MRSIIIDASVALKWFLKDERETDEALSLLRKMHEGKLKLVIPELWLYELANALKSNVDAKRITVRYAMKVLADLLKLDLVLIDFASILQLTFSLANKLNISVYDATYLALAKSQNLPFYTADKRLTEKVPSSFKNVYNLVDLRLETD